MSVINKMLKDLEERNQPTTEIPAVNPIIVNQPAKSTSSIMVVFVSVALSVLIAGAVWLYLENQKLQLNQSVVNQAAVNQVPVTQLAVNKLPDDNASGNQQGTTQIGSAASSASVSNIESMKNSTDDTLASQQQSEVSLKVEKPVSVSVNNASMRVTAITEIPEITEITEQETPTAPVDSGQSESKPSLSIARKQLSPEQLATQKMAQVEKAMMEGQGQLAEQLLQDVILLTPKNSEARKQLAALWFAQGQLQGALNILNQGIAAMPKFADFRLMKAKILLQQNNAQGAYQTLLALPSHPQIEYQSILAQAAQHVGELASAVNAYRQLVQLQPAKGKWQLGLAIALDRNSEFTQAINAYRQALALGDISTQSRQFALQRMTELGD